MKKNKAKTVTFRLEEDLYTKCIRLAIQKSKEKNKIVKLSDIIRDAISKSIK